MDIGYPEVALILDFLFIFSEPAALILKDYKIFLDYSLQLLYSSFILTLPIISGGVVSALNWIFGPSLFDQLVW